MTRTVTLLGYALLVVGALVVEVGARRRGRATFRDAVLLVLRWPPGRIVLMAGWLWVGWHVFVRVDWR